MSEPPSSRLPLGVTESAPVRSASHIDTSSTVRPAWEAQPAALPVASATLWRSGSRVFVLVALPQRTFTVDTRVPTAAELQVASLILRGLSHEGIARQRGTSKRTIVNQVGSLYRKLGCASRSDLLALFAARCPQGFGADGRSTRSDGLAGVRIDTLAEALTDALADAEGPHEKHVA